MAPGASGEWGSSTAAVRCWTISWCRRSGTAAWCRVRKNYRIYSPHAQHSERSGIVSFAHPQYETAAIKQRLKEQGIVTTTRSGWVRVAPHFYNTVEEIDRLIAALP
jgi:selenocysteine lyase/cysteine desulfurase